MVRYGLPEEFVGRIDTIIEMNNLSKNEVQDFLKKIFPNQKMNNKMLFGFFASLEENYRNTILSNCANKIFTGNGTYEEVQY